MAVRTLDLYDLLAPQFLLGFTFPAHIDSVLSVLAVDELRTTFDADLVVYTGTLMSPQHSNFRQLQPQGTSFGWRGNKFDFRLSISRDATTQIDQALHALTDPLNTRLVGVKNLLNALRPAGETPGDPIAHPHPESDRLQDVTDYPGFAFKLEILVDVLNFELSDDWVPGQLDAVSHRVVPSELPGEQGERVIISLPKVVLEYRQGANLGEEVQFAINSWGGGGIDAPHDLSVGNFISMSPSIALYNTDERSNEISFAFSVDEIILDLSEKTTPTEILRHFGTSEDFQGLYFNQMLVYYSNEQGVGFNLRVHDALISFDGQVSLEGALDVFFKAELTLLSVTTRIYTGAKEQDFTHGKIAMPTSPPTVTVPSKPPGRAEVTKDSVLHVEISGGEPPYTVQVYRGQDTAVGNLWDEEEWQFTFDTLGEENYLIIVKDGNMDGNTPLPRTYAEWLTVKVKEDTNPTPEGGTGTPADRPEDPRHELAILTPVTPTPFTDALRIDHRPASIDTIETISIPGKRAGKLTITRGGSLSVLTQMISEDRRSYSFEVPYGATYQVEINLLASSQPAVNTVEVAFRTDYPYQTTMDLAAYINCVSKLTVVGVEGHKTIKVPRLVEDSSFSKQIKNIDVWIGYFDQIAVLKVDGFASYRPPNLGHDQVLSENRMEIGIRVATELGIDPRIISSDSHSNMDYTVSGERNGADIKYQCFRLTATFKDQHATTIEAIISRPEAPPATPPDQPPVVRRPTPKAPPPPNNMPTVLNRLGFRVRLERNEMVLLELNGELDFETALEKKRREQGVGSSGDQLRLVNGNGAQGTPDGVVQFRARYTFNTATREYGVGFVLGSHPDDPDGLLHMTNGTGPQSETFRNIFGALAIFVPIINAAAVNSAEDSRSAGAWIGLGTSLSFPIAVGSLNIVRTRRVVLYGGELMTKISKSGADEDSSFQLGLMLDYGVEFDIVVPALGIGTDRDVAEATAPPLKVRYKAIGFALHHHSTSGGLDYSPIFDSSKGYDLQLSDPSLFSMNGPLGNLFGVTAARLAHFNPLTLELDMAIKQDLGVITVDKFKVKIPLEAGHPVQIMPSGVRVNIPGTLIGNGFVNIVDSPFTDSNGNVVRAKGIEGGLDLTIIAMKLRVAGNVGVTALTDPDSGRQGVGVFVGLKIEFPSPIVLGASGLGLYGLLGLFAMHYRRLEEPVAPTDPVGPALRWLVKAKGDPTQLVNSSGRLWAPAFDRWSFGVGVILGTMDTGFTANFQGMFVLELPGPRILIMAKMKFISAKPAGVDADTNQLTTGIIAIIDIDFDQQKITIGVLIDFEIEEVLQLKVPVEILFKLDDPSHWHIWLGTHSVPVSANILGIARGSAYFMIQGHELTFPDNLPYIPAEAPILGLPLPGVAIALGMQVSLVYGSKRARLYLEIGAGFHVGMSFQPFLLAGSMFFRGELMLYVASIGARGNLDVEISRKGQDPYYVSIRGEVCGSIDLWFFEVSACIKIRIEKGVQATEPPPLVNGLYLQSYAPVLVSGQGGSRPIDASLGNAVEGRTTTELPVVPIDTVPVLQFSASPVTDGLTTFTQNTGPSPDLRTSDGWVEASATTRLRYELLSIGLVDSAGAVYTDPDPVPACWRVNISGDGLTNGSHRSLDLALFSRVPTTADRAVERSEQLKKMVTVRWGNLCTPPAPPTPVFYTFCGQPLGPSRSGWILRGLPKPDLEGTLRDALPRADLRITEPSRQRDSWQDLLAELGTISKAPARLIGVMAVYWDALLDGNSHEPEKPQPFPLKTEPDKTCIDFTKANDFNPFDLLRDELVIAADPSVRRLRENIFRPLDMRALTPSARLEAIIDSRRLGTLPIGRVNVDRLGDAGLLRVDHNPRSTTITHNGVTLTEAEIIDYLNTRGVALGTLGMQFRQAVCRVEITLLATAKTSGHVSLIALNASGRVVDKTTLRVEFRNSDRLQVMVLDGEGIVTVTVETKGSKGVITQLCYYQNCQGEPSQSDQSCLRVLQLGHPVRNNNPGAEAVLSKDDLRQQVERHKEKNPVTCLLDLATDRVEYITFLAAVFPKFMGRIHLQELDKTGKVLFEHQLSNITKTELVGAASVPSDWLDEALPWREKFLSTARFLYSGLFDKYTKYVFNFKPGFVEDCVTLRFVTSTTHPGVPPLYLAAVEMLRRAEIEQQAFIASTLQSDRERLESYLSQGESDRPLLRPDTIYHLTTTYRATVETTQEDGSISTKQSTLDQTWSFRTDDEPPAELKPYILGTTPQLDEEYHFFRDPLKVVFNDRSTLELYRTYGKTIRGVIRKADGGPIDGSPDELTELTGQPADVLTPYRDLVLDLIKGGGHSCVGGSHLVEHGVYEAPFGLQPLMAYTFDLEVDPPRKLGESENYVPPLRRAFRTSRFADVHNFAESVFTLPVHSLALTSPLLPPPAPPPVISEMNDKDLETLLSELGVPLSSGAERTAVWLLWQDTGSSYRPAALLIDAAEPMWRTREVMKKTTITNGALSVEDPAFQIWETGREASLTVVEGSSGNLVDYMVRSTGGTRALVVLKADRMPVGSAEVILNLELLRPGNDFYGLAEEKAALLHLTLTAKAPWE